jgi:hypothetical protein
MRKLILVVSAVSLIGCTEHLKHINQTLEGVTGVRGGGSAQPPSGPRLPHPTPAQIEALQNQLTVKNADGLVSSARQEAWPTIQRVIGFVACYPGYDGERYLGQYRAPNNGSIWGVMASLHYHPKSQCLTVVRLDNWSMPARNALAFRAVYISEASGEGRDRTYELVKQPDGAWLFTRG